MYGFGTLRILTTSTWTQKVRVYIQDVAEIGPAQRPY